MKKDSKANRFIYRLATRLFLLLGFSACNAWEEDKEMLLMYGTPTADFAIKGKVVDGENKASGLPDIQIVIRNKHSRFYADTLYTDKDGEFVYQTSDMLSNPIRIIYEDTQTGVFKKDSVEVKLEQIKPGNGPWHDGTYEADVTIEMERKAAEEEE